MLPQHEWLPHAKALAVGMKNRITHRNERRPNLVVGNAHDRFWAYCQACREGAVLEKDHVRLDLADVELPSQLERPLDARPVHGVGVASMSGCEASNASRMSSSEPAP